MNDIVIWIESHPTSVNVLTSAAIVFVAGLSGAFAFLQRYRRKPLLEIAGTASIVFLESLKEFDGRKNLVRAAFVINASVINASNERVVVDQFLLSFRTYGIWRSHKQNLVRIAFPSRPRKRLGKGTKYMGVWFTQYPEDDVQIEHITGVLEPKELCGGYLLFTSFTYGNWNPKIQNHKIHTRLHVKLTSQKWLKKTTRLRVVTDGAIIEEMFPGIIDHLQEESTWNHDLSVYGK